jgi:hypothetical protein
MLEKNLNKKLITQFYSFLATDYTNGNSFILPIKLTSYIDKNTHFICKKNACGSKKRKKILCNWCCNKSIKN